MINLGFTVIDTNLRKSFFYILYIIQRDGQCFAFFNIVGYKRIDHVLLGNEKHGRWQVERN